MAAARPRLLVFDVNETLLDLGPLKQRVGMLLQDPAAGTLWFTMLLQHALVMTVAGHHASFAQIGAATLGMLAQGRGIALDRATVEDVVAGMRRLPPHPDAAPALERLRGAGLRLTALTNSPDDGARAQLAHAGLDGFFERIMSVDSVGRFKPDPGVYTWAVHECGLVPAECMMVAAHGWDIAGAQWAGLRGAFIARPGQRPFPLAPAPELELLGLGALADALVAKA